jgi:hypothetical protein
MTGSHGSVPPGPARQCARCGALGTHYLTCPSLRLPPGYRLAPGPGARGVPDRRRPAWTLVRRPGPPGLAPAAPALRPSADYVTSC